MKVFEDSSSTHLWNFSSVVKPPFNVCHFVSLDAAANFSAWRVAENFLWGRIFEPQKIRERIVGWWRGQKIIRTMEVHIGILLQDWGMRVSWAMVLWHPSWKCKILIRRIQFKGKKRRIGWLKTFITIFAWIFTDFSKIFELVVTGETFNVISFTGPMIMYLTGKGSPFLDEFLTERSTKTWPLKDSRDIESPLGSSNNFPWNEWVALESIWRGEDWNWVERLEKLGLEVLIVGVKEPANMRGKNRMRKDFLKLMNRYP